MGVFFMIRSPALIEDIYMPEGEKSPAEFIADMNKYYSQVCQYFVIAVDNLFALK